MILHALAIQIRAELRVRLSLNAASYRLTPLASYSFLWYLCLIRSTLCVQVRHNRAGQGLLREGDAAPDLPLYALPLGLGVRVSPHKAPSPLPCSVLSACDGASRTLVVSGDIIRRRKRIEDVYRSLPFLASPLRPTQNPPPFGPLCTRRRVAHSGRLT